MPRQLSGFVVIRGTDDENWPFDNEHVEQTRSVQTVLDIDQAAQVVNIEPVRWGGECRVELGLTARAVSDGQIQIEGSAKLFEGDNENTSDLEQEKTVNFLVPRTTRNNSEPARHDVQLVSEGFGGGDHAEISMVFTNVLVEED